MGAIDMKCSTHVANPKNRKTAVCIAFCASVVVGILLYIAWWFGKGYTQCKFVLGRADFFIDFLFLTAGSSVCFLLLCVCLRSIMKPICLLFLLLPFLCLTQVTIETLCLPVPMTFWVKGLAWRASRRLDLDRASEWSKECVEKYETGTLPVTADPVYYSRLDAEITPEEVPDFITKPWRIRPVVGIMNPGMYTDEACLCLSWYGYHFLLAEPKESIKDLPFIEILSKPSSAFVIYDNPK